MSVFIMVFAVVGFMTFVAVCFIVPKVIDTQARLSKEQFERIDAGRKTMAQIIGGGALILTFSWGVVKDSNTLEQGRQQEANKQFLDAGKMLRDESDIIASVTAIYALGDVATVRPEFHMRVRETLASYLRSSARDLDEESNNGGAYRRISQAQQVALDVLAARDLSKDDSHREVFLNGSYLAGADFFRSKGFARAYFQGAALYGANFRFSDFRGARFDGARFSDWQAFGKDWRDDLTPQSKEWFWKKYVYSVNFEGANLQDAIFINASLSGAIFRGANLSRVDFSGSNLSRADFTGAIGTDTAVFNSEGRVACADKAVVGLSRSISSCHAD
ncbi:pentapeptide repeat-containing protein [Pseudomonas azerbaijanoccidentalis]